jgi:alpha-ketoglutarate-dependent 2,4-dichlorophenoxyacetate dioxygenase
MSEIRKTVDKVTLHIEPLHPLFAARVTGIDLSTTLTEAQYAEVLAALDRYSVLVFPEQAIDNAAHVRFSEWFGPLERMLKGSVGNGSAFAGITNVDPETDAIFTADDHRMQRQYSNELWHTDSSFKAVSAWISLLHAKEIPSDGGDTSFACLHQAWQDLQPSLKVLCEPLAVEHDFVYSRSILNTAQFLSTAQKAEVPAVPQRLVLQNPRTMRKSLYLGSHAARVLGWDTQRGRALLDKLTAHATQGQYVYKHAWHARELVMWDDRATMHQGSAWDYQNQRRVLVRTTVSAVNPTIDADGVDTAIAAAQQLSDLSF